jgi:CubicO group peptidase (beta-lactamase class C family)
VGNGGQYIFVIPARQLVVVRFARMPRAADSAHHERVGWRMIASLMQTILGAAGVN